MSPNKSFRNKVINTLFAYKLYIYIYIYIYVYISLESG